MQYVQVSAGSQLLLLACQHCTLTWLQAAPPAVATEAQRKIAEAADLGLKIAVLVEGATKVDMPAGHWSSAPDSSRLRRMQHFVGCTAHVVLEAACSVQHACTHVSACFSPADHMSTRDSAQVLEQSDELEGIAEQEKEAAKQASERARSTAHELEVWYHNRSSTP